MKNFWMALIPFTFVFSVSAFAQETKTLITGDEKITISNPMVPVERIVEVEKDEVILIKGTSKTSDDPLSLPEMVFITSTGDIAETQSEITYNMEDEQGFVSFNIIAMEKAKHILRVGLPGIKTGEITLNVRRMTLPKPQILKIGKENQLEGKFTESTPVQVYEIELEAGKTVQVNAQGIESLDSRIRVFNERDELVISNDDSSDYNIDPAVVLVPSESGRFRVVCDSAYCQPGQFIIEGVVQELPTLPLDGSIVTKTFKRGDGQFANTVQWFDLKVKAGKTYYVKVSEDASKDSSVTDTFIHALYTNRRGGMARMGLLDDVFITYPLGRPLPDVAQSKLGEELINYQIEGSSFERIAFIADEDGVLRIGVGRHSTERREDYQISVKEF